MTASSPQAGAAPPLRLAARGGPDLPAEPEVADELAELEAHSQDLAIRTRSAATRRAYRGAWRSFAGFCHLRGLDPCPRTRRRCAGTSRGCQSRPTRPVCRGSR